MTPSETLKRSCYCGEISRKHQDQTVTLMGWVDRRRDLGNLIFLDLRDRTGVVQVVVHPAQRQALETARKVRSEFVLAVQGRAVLRSPETVNPHLATGELEVQAEQIVILNRAETPPFPIAEADPGTAEETRLRYRYLDLRRPRFQRNLRLRHEICLEIRRYLDERGFLEIETPFLTKSTPEGARDYLVPSRLYPGNFYALPQSPQLFKQLLMVAGFDRYFQIVRCFRDEDLRADRQPEFTQVDIEMSFVQPPDVFELVEGLLQRVFARLGLELSPPFPRLSYQEALRRYGTDRPDLRFGLELLDLSASFQETPFQVFRRILEEGGCVLGIRVPGGSRYSRRELEDLAGLVAPLGVPALSWLRLDEGGLRGSFPKAVPPAQLQEVAQAAGLQAQDLLLLAAGPRELLQPALGALRLELAQREKLARSDQFSFLWVYDFPLLEWDAQTKRFYACHHPFTSPKEEDLHLLEEQPGAVRAKAYDVILNGTEIGGGSIRIHRPEIQARIFQVLGIGPEEAESKFGFFLEALRYGAPPHGGIALGLDRIIMLACGETSIRDVIAFPKTARALDLMCGAPSPVSAEQLRELHLRILE